MVMVTILVMVTIIRDGDHHRDGDYPTIHGILVILRIVIIHCYFPKGL